MLNIRWLRSMRMSIFLLIGVATIVAILTNYSLTALSKSADSWMSADDFTLTLHDNQNYDLFHEPNCTDEDVQLHPDQFMWAFEGELSTECVYDMGDWKYALSQRRFAGWFYYQPDAKSFIFNIDDGHRMYKVMNLTDHVTPIFIPHSKSVAKYVLSSMPGADGLHIYKNILERITPNGDESFTADLAAPDFVFKRSDGLVQPIGRMGVSENGKWMIFEAINVGLVRLNLDTYEMKRFAAASSLRSVGYDQSARFDVSDDGVTVVTAGREKGFNIYSVEESCGDKNLDYYSNKITALSNACPMRNLGDDLRKMNAGFSYASEVDINKDADEIDVWANPANPYSGFNSGRYVLRIKDVMPEFRLDYLALGDSFSSGEGDTQVHQGNKFYLSGTDVDGDERNPTEKCHVSSRSYPFLLKDAMGLADYSMHSLACSGAELGKDYIVSNDYRGQNSNGSPRLSMLLPESLQEYQSIAGLNFIPGRIQQLEFIDRYKPRAVTITGGGNDVGFGEVIRSCLMSNYYSCSYSSTQSGKAAIGQGIARQYYKLIDLFAQIKRLSPDTKVYIVGYPQFVDDKSFFCAPNVPISQNERKMIMEAVIYLNQVIEAAAVHSGVKYVDIENSLDGHKLCEKGTSYVTGLALARTIGFGTKLINHSELQESFHPNKNGHLLMANAIKDQLNSQSLLYYDDYPAKSDVTGPIKLVAPSEYFAESMTNATKSYLKDTIISKKYVQKSSPTDVFDVRFGGFAPNSQVMVEVHSDPVVLGGYDTDANGFLSVDISVPDKITAGFHTLHLIGETYSGDVVDIWQGIEVRGKDGDTDEDGIADSVDGCMYVAEIGVDLDDDEIDDACDAEIDALNQERSYTQETTVRHDEQIKEDAEQGGANKNGSFADMKTPQRYTKELFNVPHLSVRSYTPSNMTYLQIPRYLIGGLIVSILILIWMVKRYSSPNRM